MGQKSAQSTNHKQIDYFRLQILEVIRASLEQTVVRVDYSKEMLKIGIVDSISEKIEHVINNPLDSLSSHSDDVSEMLKKLIIAKIVGELQAYKNEINSVHLLKDKSDDLFFIISLKENTFENRDKILDVAADFQSKPISSRHMVFFQFIEPDMENDLIGTVKIEVDAELSQ